MKMDKISPYSINFLPRIESIPRAPGLASKLLQWGVKTFRGSTKIFPLVSTIVDLYNRAIPLVQLQLNSRGPTVDRFANPESEVSDNLSGDRTSETDQDHFFAPEVVSRPVDGEIVGSHLIVLPEGCTAPQAVALLSKDIQPNQYGLPPYFIRSDLLSSIALGHISQDEVDAASVGLFYNEGYPTLEDGRAFWNRLPHEPDQAYELFQRYLEQAEETGIRQLDMLAHAHGLEVSLLRAMYQEFYWSARARAFDLFVVVAQERKRQLRIRKMENSHYDLAGEKLNEILNRLSTDDPDTPWWDELDAKEAVELFIELAKLQRLSVGLTGQNASSLPKAPLPEGASTQTIMEHLTRGANLGQEQEDNFQQKLGALLNGEGGMELQDAIIRFSRPQQTAPAPFGMDD